MVMQRKGYIATIGTMRAFADSTAASLIRAP